MCVSHFKWLNQFNKLFCSFQKIYNFQLIICIDMCVKGFYLALDFRHPQWATLVKWQSLSKAGFIISML